MLTKSHRQEALSRAYVRAIAAQAGLAVSEPENDYGIDMTLRAILIRGKRPRDIGPQLDMQLKSSTRAIIGDSDLVYDLAVVNYDDLREINNQPPRILVIFVMPVNEMEWLSQSHQEFSLRDCCYWIYLKWYPASSSISTVRLSIPLANIFSVAALQEMIERLRQRKDL